MVSAYSVEGFRQGLAVAGQGNHEKYGVDMLELIHPSFTLQCSTVDVVNVTRAAMNIEYRLVNTCGSITASK